ncbi:MAG TPA: DUF3795 domain-containing protein [Syntrophales bacterium]|nr:DUF3795 domain-containing protein [Syntrophales bacterium]
MKYDEILKLLAPCGLNCSKCMAFTNGDIKKNANELKRLLGSFDSYADRFSSFLPVFKNYPSFKKLLEYFAQADCKGCRNGDCKYPNCGVASCYKQKEIDFCFQCNEFPCEKTSFDPNLKKRWMQMNNLMKQKGVEAYFEETKDLPRYI